MSIADRPRPAGSLSARSAAPAAAVALALVVAALAPAPAQAALGYGITFDDPTGAGHGLYGQIDAHVGAALSQWSTVLTGSATFQIQVQITDGVDRAGASSLASGFVGTQGPWQIYEQGLAYQLRTGIDPNGAAPDMRLLLNPDYLRNELWFDPAPLQRTAAVDPTRTDATSIFVHEIGHALAFNGWGDLVDGQVSGGYASPWDVNTRYDGQTLFFTGARAQAVYGGPVPLTDGNNFHLGNAVGAGVDLRLDVMNGVTFERGLRYGISQLDVAMLQDLGVGAVPEPPMWALWLGALSMLALRRHRATAR